MAFVIDRFWLPLLLAGIIGFMVAWATCGRPQKSWTSSWLPLALLAAIGGIFAAVQAMMPGRAGLWLESALLMFASYLAGCCIACLWRRLAFGREAITEIATVAAAAGARDLAAAPPRVAERQDHGDGSLSAVVAASGAGIVAAATTLAAASPKAAAEVENAEKAAVPVAPASTAIPVAAVGVEPPLLHRPRNGVADDLTMIWGVAEKLEQRMNRMGIWHFDQIAAWNDDHVAWFEHEVEGFKGRIERDKWIEQCQKLAKGWRPDSKVGTRPKG